MSGSGGGGGFAVTESALQAFLQTSDQRAQEFRNCLHQAGELQLSPGAFGRIPGVGDRVDKAYTEHTESCIESIASTADAMDSVSAGIQATKQDYHDSDANIAENLAHIQWEDSNISIRGTR